MAFIYNPRSEKVETKVFGNYMSFPPDKIKYVEQKTAEFIRENRGGLGLVTLPEEFEDPEFRATKEGKRVLAERSKEGIANRVSFLRDIVRNLTVSLRADMDSRNQKGDPRLYASDGEIAAMRELAALQNKEADDQKKRVQEIGELEKLLDLGE